MSEATKAGQPLPVLSSEGLGCNAQAPAKERPIPIIAPQVRALLAGTMTQMRLVCKPQPDIVAEGGTVVGVNTPDDAKHGRLGKVLSCPYGAPGDRLWVREDWRAEGYFDGRPPRDLAPGMHIAYEAGRQDVMWPAAMGKLRPGRFMPRWASRITLEVTGVRVDRLNDISEADALAEGVYDGTACRCAEPLDFVRSCGMCSGRLVDAVGLYRALWERINGPGSWNANPLVWVVAFHCGPNLQPNA